MGKVGGVGRDGLEKQWRDEGWLLSDGEEED
jgi:hypothetical protein